MSTKVPFPCGGGSNLILGTGMENQIFILRTPATIEFFHQILKNCHFGVKKNHYPPRWICMTHIWSPTLLPIDGDTGNSNFESGSDIQARNQFKFR